jgi:hypothetical protein
MKNNKLLLFVLFFTWSPILTLAEESIVDVSGSARLSIWERDKSFSSNQNYWVGGLWLQLRPQEILGAKSYFDLKFQNQDMARSNNTGFGSESRILNESTLREAFVERSWGAVDLKIGRQITVWGRADKLNPTDVLSTKDLVFLATDDEEQRNGVFATQLIANFEGYRLIGIWQPEWRSPRFPLSPQSPGVNLSYGVPLDSKNQYAVKLDKSGSDVDWSLSFANAIDRVPDLKVLQAGASGTDLELSFKEIQMYGLDAATVVGDFGLRTEMAVVSTSDNQGTDFLTKNSYYHAVIGADRTFDGFFNVNAQYSVKSVVNWKDTSAISDQNQRTLANQVNILSNQDAPTYHSASLRLAAKFLNETLDTDLVFAGWFNNGIIRPKVTYSYSDRTRFIVGAEFYRGESQSFFGRLQNLSSGYLEFRYLF